MAQIAGPLAAADISAYYISTFNFDHALVSTTGWGRGSQRDTEAQKDGGGQEVVPAGQEVGVALTPFSPTCPQVPEDGISSVIEVLQRRQEGLGS